MYKVLYVPSESIPFQGNDSEVQRRRKQGYSVRARGGGGGNWLAIKRSDVLVNGESYREFVLDHYGRNNLTEALAKQFEQDLNTGKVTLP